MSGERRRMSRRMDDSVTRTEWNRVARVIVLGREGPAWRGRSHVRFCCVFKTKLGEKRGRRMTNRDGGFGSGELGFALPLQ